MAVLAGPPMTLVKQTSALLHAGATAAGRGINSTSKVFSELSGGLQSLNAVVNHVRPLIQRMMMRRSDADGGLIPPRRSKRV